MIDDKLRKILQSPHRDSTGAEVMIFPTTKILEQIKQAFIDEGYRDTSHYEEVNIAIDGNGIAYPAIRRDPNLMTGQEWYDRMMDVIHDQPDSFMEAPDGKEVVLCYPLLAVDRAARRAAGLERENQG